MTRVLSLGAGVQSSALYMMYVNGDLPSPPAFAVFADTHAEPSAVYEWLNKLETWGGARIPIHRVSAGDIAADHLSGERYASAPFFLRTEVLKPYWELGEGRTESPTYELVAFTDDDGKQAEKLVSNEAELIEKLGEPTWRAGAVVDGMTRRQCTPEYKIAPVKAFVREKLGYKPRQKITEPIETILGISLDEPHRLKRSGNDMDRLVYPLAFERPMRRQDCILYVESQGLGTPPRSACWMCPYRSDQEWLHLRDTDPEAFQKAIEFDSKIRAPYRGLRGERFLHRSLKPLSEVELDPYADQLGLFCGAECGT